MSNTNRAAQLESLRKAAERVYSEADASAERDAPINETNELYSIAADAFRELQAARSQVAA